MPVNKPEISALSEDVLGHLVGTYAHALWRHNEPWGEDDFNMNALSESRQKKVCKLIHEFFNKENDDVIPEEVRSYLFSEKEPLALLTFFQECHSRLLLLGGEKEARQKQILDDFPQEVRSALSEILTTLGCEWEVACHDHALEIVVTDTDACTQSLILYGVEKLPAKKKGFTLSEPSLTRTEGGYCLKGDLYNENTGSLSTVNAFPFTHAEVKTSFYRADRHAFLDNPWHFLIDTAFNICMRWEYLPDWINHEEQALLPFLRELAALRYPSLLDPSLEEEKSEEPRPLAFPLLKELLKEDSAILSLLDELEQVLPYSTKYDYRSKRLIAKLCMAKYEPLWRELYGKLSASQEAYPSKVETLCPRQTLQDTRACIAVLLAEKGYTGTYPDFVKIAPMKGIHLAESYSMVYWVGMERCAVHRIRCLETLEEGELRIQFLCTAALGKDKEALPDALSCTFNAKGKRLGSAAEYTLALPRRSKAEELEALGGCVRIAVKRAELRRLSKADRLTLQKDPFLNRDLWRMFLIWLIFGGGLFAVGMTLFFMLMTVLSGENSFSGVITDPFWLWMFPLTWVGFGGLMGIAMVCVTALSRRK